MRGAAVSVHQGKAGMGGRKAAWRRNGAGGYEKELARVEMNVENKNQKWRQNSEYGVFIRKEMDQESQQTGGGEWEVAHSERSFNCCYVLGNDLNKIFCAHTRATSSSVE